MELSTDRTHLRRAAGVFVAGVAVELVLVVLADRAPAMATLIRPLYWVAGLLFLFGIVKALKTRSGVDRRQHDRRGGAGDDSGRNSQDSPEDGAAR